MCDVYNAEREREREEEGSDICPRNSSQSPVVSLTSSPNVKPHGRHGSVTTGKGILPQTSSFLCPLQGRFLCTFPMRSSDCGAAWRVAAVRGVLLSAIRGVCLQLLTVHAQVNDINQEDMASISQHVIVCL